MRHWCNNSKVADTSTRRRKVRWILGTAAILIATVGTILSVPTSSKPATIPLPYPESSGQSMLAALAIGSYLPGNVESAFYVPRGTVQVGQEVYDNGTSSFDRALILRLPIAGAAASEFFDVALSDKGWNVIYNKVAGAKSTLIARIAGSDGNFWEVGVTQTVPKKFKGKGGNLVETRILQIQPQ